MVRSALIVSMRLGAMMSIRCSAISRHPFCAWPTSAGPCGRPWPRVCGPSERLHFGCRRGSQVLIEPGMALRRGVRNRRHSPLGRLGESEILTNPVGDDLQGDALLAISAGPGVLF